MGSTKFMLPKEEISGGEAEKPRKLVSPNLYVANCGPAVDLSYEAISMAFNQFGEVKGVHAADDSGTRVIVSFPMRVLLNRLSTLSMAAIPRSLLAAFCISTTPYLGRLCRFVVVISWMYL